MNKKPACLAPFVHTYCSPQGERRLCCASREPATNFKQYIDTDGPTGEFSIPTLNEHWNSEHMKRIRRDHMAGNLPPECEVCDKKLLNTDVYRDYFEHLFGHHREEILAKTESDGYYHGMPKSWDYRFNNNCNLKCRMCGPMLSSSWEVEARKHNPNHEQNEPWVNYKEEIEANSYVMHDEMWNQINSTEEIYWVGGEPLMFKQHWMLMADIVRLTSRASEIYVRYNTNLTRTTDPYKIYGADIWNLLDQFRDWQICASLDGTGAIGEYIRTGLDYHKFIKNFEEGLAAQKHHGQMRLDFTLTMPGLFEVRNMFDLSKKYNVPLLTKVCFEFSNDIAMCPLFLPKDVLHPIVQDLIDELAPHADRNQHALIDVLTNLLERDTMDMKYTDYKEGRVKGKKRIEYLEDIRMQPVTMQEIFARNSDAALDFWNGIV